jgi:hypothetical protein
MRQHKPSATLRGSCLQELEGELAATKKSLEQAQAEMRTLNQVWVGNS